MTTEFVDTSFYIALLNSRDADHSKATEFAKRHQIKYLTTEFVLVEVGNWLSRSQDRNLFVQLLENLKKDGLTKIQPASQELFEQGTKLYRDRMDKNWSVTDCISFAVMTNEKLSEALTSDHHFEQAGYVALLK